MNRKHSNLVKAAAVTLVLCSCAFADSAIDNALAKVPTQSQMAEYDKIFYKFQDKDEEISHEADALGEKIDDAVHLPGVQFNRGHIDAARVIHKKLRVAYLENFNELMGWAGKSNRTACLHQAEKTQAYTINVSDAWLARVAALPLSTEQDRILAYGIVLTGGGSTFRPADSDPVRNGVGREMEGLNAVCMGGQSEYEPVLNH